MKLNIEWDGLIDEFKVQPCSSGSWRVEIKTRMFGKETLKALVEDLITLRNVSPSVENTTDFVKNDSYRERS